MSVIKELKGGSLSKTVVLAADGQQWVRKYISTGQDREYGLVRWQSQLRKIQYLRERLPENILPVLGAGRDQSTYYYDIPYIENSDNLYEAIMNGVSYTDIADKVIKIIQMMASASLDSIPGSISVYLNEELIRPMQHAHAILEASDQFLSSPERAYLGDRLKNIAPQLEQLIQKYSNYSVPESITHGNFTLENAIWDYEKNSIILIDLYAETYCETILGDISQIYQSSKSGYEIVTELLSQSEYSVTEYPYHQLPKVLENFTQYFEQKISNEPWYNTELITLLTASQFTRMFPFKIVKDPRAGFLFMNHALDLLGAK
jgi:hypothetical protein